MARGPLSPPATSQAGTVLKRTLSPESPLEAGGEREVLYIPGMGESVLVSELIATGVRARSRYYQVNPPPTGTASSRPAAASRKPISVEGEVEEGRTHQESSGHGSQGSSRRSSKDSEAAEVPKAAPRPRPAKANVLTARPGTPPPRFAGPAPHEGEEDPFAWQDGHVSDKTRSHLLSSPARGGRSTTCDGGEEDKGGVPPPEHLGPKGGEGGRGHQFRRRAVTARVAECPVLAPRSQQPKPATGGRHRTWHQWNTLRGCPPTVKEPMENKNMQQLLILAYEKAAHDMEKGLAVESSGRSQDRAQLDLQLLAVYDWIRGRERLDWLIYMTENGRCWTMLDDAPEPCLECLCIHPVLTLCPNAMS